MNSRSRRKKKRAARKESKPMVIDLFMSAETKAHWEEWSLGYLKSKLGSDFKKPVLYKDKNIPSDTEAPSIFDFLELANKTNENK